MLTHRIITRIALGHEPGAWIEARMPSLAILDRANDISSRKAIAKIAGLDMSQFRNIAPVQQQSERSDYDWQTLLAACITAWSYEEPVTADNIAELDEPTVNCVLDVLLARESEDDQKKGSDSYTIPSKITDFRHPNG